MVLLPRSAVLAGVLVCLGVSGCATGYTRQELEPWMKSVQELKGDEDANRLRAASIAWLLAPAFNDDAFTPVFGKPFSALSARERHSIWLSLVEHYPQPWVVVGLAVPFQDKGVPEDQRRLWLAQIDSARKEPFTETVSRRKQEAEAKRLADLGRQQNLRTARDELERDAAKRAAQQTRELKLVARLIAEAIAAGARSNQESRTEAEQQGAAQDQAWEQDGGCHTWFELTDAETIAEVMALYPGSAHYDFQRQELFEMLRNYPWNNATLGVTEKLLRSFPGASISEKGWADFRDARSAIWKIQKTKLCR